MKSSHEKLYSLLHCFQMKQKEYIVKYKESEAFEVRKYCSYQALIYVSYVYRTKRLIEHSNNNISRVERLLGILNDLSIHNQLTYSLWYPSNHLHFEAGNFTCERCNLGFTHSPATIKRGAKVLYDSCCGECSNELIGERIFTT